MARSTKWAWWAFGLAALAIALPILEYLFVTSYARYWFWVPYVVLAAAVAAIVLAAASAYRAKSIGGWAGAALIAAALACLIAPFWISVINNHGEIRILRALNAVDTGSWEQVGSERSGNDLCFDACTRVTRTFETSESVDQVKATLNHTHQ